MRRGRARRCSSASAARRARPPCDSFSALCSALASAFFLCGPSTMIMLRPSCLGEDSTKPSSVTSSASRCSSRNPSSGRCCSRPRNMIVILTLSPALQEPHDVTLLGLVVVLVDLGTKLHLLDDHVRLVPTRLTGLLGVLVLELPVVHELADGRLALRRDLDQVEVGLLGELQCLVGRDDADGLAVGSDEADLGNPDPVVDTQLGADMSSMWSSGRKTPSTSRPKSKKASARLQAEASRDTSPAGSAYADVAGRGRSLGTGPDDLCLSCQRRSMRVGDVMLLVSACGSARPAGMRN